MMDDADFCVVVEEEEEGVCCRCPCPCICAGRLSCSDNRRGRPLRLTAGRSTDADDDVLVGACVGVMTAIRLSGPSLVDLVRFRAARSTVCGANTGASTDPDAEAAAESALLFVAESASCSSSGGIISDGCGLARTS